MVRGETLHQGLYDNPVEAAGGRDRKALEVQGPYAYLNSPKIRAEHEKKEKGPGEEPENKGA